MADQSAAAPPRRSLLGSSTLPDLLRLLSRRRWAVDAPHRLMLFRALVDSCGATALSCCQEFLYGADVRRVTLREPPLFVLGHWRSGTTFLHDLLACDPRHSYPTTYDCFMPNHFLLTEDFVARRAARAPANGQRADGLGHAAGGRVRPGLARPAVSLPEHVLSEPFSSVSGVPRPGRRPIEPTGRLETDAASVPAKDHLEGHRSSRAQIADAYGAHQGAARVVSRRAASSTSSATPIR